MLKQPLHLGSLALVLAASACSAGVPDPEPVGTAASAVRPHPHSAGDCNDDSQCPAEAPICDPVTKTCVQCTSAAQCEGATPACDPDLSICVACDGDTGSGTKDACDQPEAPYCFLAGPMQGQCGRCATDADCQGHPGGDVCDPAFGFCAMGCTSDAQCKPSEWCEATFGTVGSCVAKLENGESLAGLPPEVSTCSPAVGHHVCKSGICDYDNQCGLMNGQGPCGVGAVCRSGVCDTSDHRCGLALGDGPCTSDDECRYATCNPVTQICGPGSCSSEYDCPDNMFCKAQQCVPQLPDGSACDAASACQSGICDAQRCTSEFAPSGGGIGCATRGPGGEGGGLALVSLVLAAAGLARRRR